jgi:hypothetical protein
VEEVARVGDGGGGIIRKISVAAVIILALLLAIVWQFPAPTPNSSLAEFYKSAVPGGCGSRGGPGGDRLPSGKCPSWDDQRDDSAAVSVPQSNDSEPNGCGSRGGPGYRLPNGQCASWDDYQRSKANTPSPPTVSAPLATPPESLLHKSAVSETTPHKPSGGCGSRGGPGYRLASGKCASWHHEHRRSRHAGD